MSKYTEKEDLDFLMNMAEDDPQPGHCWRCGNPFDPDDDGKPNDNGNDLCDYCNYVSEKMREE